jgi:hypothetical protein
MKYLATPPAAQRDENSVQMISGWIAEKAQHTTLNIGMWANSGRNEPDSWGIFLADTIRHIGMALEQEFGQSREDVVDAIRASLDKELDNPTRSASGKFHVGQT